ncbi:histidine phosphatase family protein, partial [Pseudomonas aeruginosa]
DRLSGVPFDAVWHSPLLRATETARVIAERLPSIDPQPSSLLFDCIPSGP